MATFRMRTLVVAAAVTVACATGTKQTDSATADVMGDSISLTTDKQTYRAGETVKLTIASTSAATYTYNPCTRIVERESAGAWTAVREERMCTMIAHLLEPGKTNNEQTEMAEGIEPGRYRLAIVFADDAPGSSRSVRAATAPLTVVR